MPVHSTGTLQNTQDKGWQSNCKEKGGYLQKEGPLAWQQTSQQQRKTKRQQYFQGVDRKCQLGTVYPEKLSFKNEGKTKTF